jgi:hypothetical protein
MKDTKLVSTTAKRKPPRAGMGRPKGAINKVTKEFRETVRQLLENNSENVGRWLLLVADGDGTDHGKPDPGKALDLLAKLAEFAAPKLGRVEHVGDGGGPVRFVASEKDQKL